MSVGSEMTTTAGDRHWREVEELFHEALELDAQDQTAFLDEKCFGKAELRKELESLLAASDRTLGFARDAVAQVARQQSPDVSLAGA